MEHNCIYTYLWNSNQLLLIKNLIMTKEVLINAGVTFLVVLAGLTAYAKFIKPQIEE